MRSAVTTTWPRASAALDLVEAFLIRQLVDIGLRALSSAINDPTTAVEVTLRLGSLLRTLFDTELPDGRRRGSPPTSLPVIGNLPRRELTGHCRVRGR
jgi:hypothetical protein